MEGIMPWPCGNAGRGDGERAKAWVFIPAYATDINSYLVFGGRFSGILLTSWAHN